MARYGRVSLIPRIFIMILFILVLGFGEFLLFDYLGILDMKQVLQPVFAFLGIQSEKRMEIDDSPLLVDSLRLEKEKKRIELLNAEIEGKMAKLEEEQQKLKQKEDEIAEKEKELAEREKSLNLLQKMYDDKKANLEQNARYLNGMPPEQAVKILLGMNDQDVIDLFRTSERLARESGRQSIVAYWLSLMPAERAADIQRKMAKKPVN